jgi:hypothetical protein
MPDKTCLTDCTRHRWAGWISPIGVVCPSRDMFKCTNRASSHYNSTFIEAGTPACDRIVDKHGDGVLKQLNLFE